MSYQNLASVTASFMGIQTVKPSVNEVIVSTLTALISTVTIIYISKVSLNYLNIATNVYILVSIAATSVLVFVVPHGVLSQPWQVIIGHLLSAFVGVVCFQFVGDYLLLAASLAVSISIMLMQIFRCVHPPGGATALGAIFGGEAIQQLGFFYILVPTLCNVLILILVAIILNYPFHWRRYPSYLYYKNNTGAKVSPGDRTNQITTEDFLKAVSEHVSFVDISEKGWVEIFENAKKHAEFDSIHPKKIKLGGIYSNGKIGKEWQVRRVTGITNKKIIKFSVEAGFEPGRKGACSYQNFIEWSKFETYKNEQGVWERNTEPKL